MEPLEGRRLLSASISGTVYDDTLGHLATAAAPNAVLLGAQVYLDLAGTGKFASGDPLQTINASGNFKYSFTGLVPGTYTVRLVHQSTDGPSVFNGVETPVAGRYTVKLRADQNVSGEDFLALRYSNRFAALPHGKVLTFNGLGNIIAGYTLDLRRFNADGTINNAYGRHGQVHILDMASPAPIDVLSAHRDGSALIGGIYDRYESAIASTNGLSLTLVNASGRIVRAVNILNAVLTEGVGVSDDRWTSVTLTADGKIVATGFSPATTRVFFDRFNADLTRDRHFGVNGRITQYGTTTLPQSISSGPGAALTLTYSDSSTIIVNAPRKKKAQ